MDVFIRRAINEHKELLERIKKLEIALANFANDDNISKQEYALMYEQLNAMRNYASCLEARLNMHGVDFDCGFEKYFEDVTEETSTNNSSNKDEKDESK